MAEDRIRYGRALDRIVSQCRTIESFCAGHDRASFLGSEVTKAAIGMSLIVIGEWLTDIRDGDPTTFAGITDGHRVIGLRHRIAHGYDDIDFDRIWTFLVEKLPVLFEETSSLRDRFVDEYKVRLD